MLPWYYSIVSIGRLAMLLKALVVRSTTQKDKAFPTGAEREQ